MKQPLAFLATVWLAPCAGWVFSLHDKVGYLVGVVILVVIGLVLVTARR